MSNTIDAMYALRVPAMLRNKFVALAVPICETSLGLLLLFGSGILRSGAAILSALMLVIFSVLLLGVLKRGEQVDCGCFGGLWGQSNVSVWSIARNCFLIAAAISTAVFSLGNSSLAAAIFMLDWEQLMTLLFGWSAVATILLSATLRRERKRQAHNEPFGHSSQLSEAGSDLPEMGDPIPKAEVVGANLQTTLLENVGRGKPALLIFLSGECGKCSQIAEQVPLWSAKLAPIKIAVVTSSRPDIVDARLAAAVPYMYYGAKSAREALGVSALPAAVALGDANQPILASPVVMGKHDVEGLVAALGAALSSTN
nr:MauE/DoxX family redox-associated membrane protein [Glutamicibacter sp.]